MKTLAEHCVTDLKSAEAAIRIKRQLCNSSTLYVSYDAFFNIVHELNKDHVAYSRGYMSVFMIKVDGEIARIRYTLK